MYVLVDQTPPLSIYQALVLVLRLSGGNVQQALAEFGLEPCSDDAHAYGHRLGDVALKHFSKGRDAQLKKALSASASESSSTRVAQATGGDGTGGSPAQSYGVLSSSSSRKAVANDTSKRTGGSGSSSSRHKKKPHTHSKLNRRQPSFADVDVNDPAVNQALVSALCDNAVEPADIEYGSYNGSLMGEMTMRVKELVDGCPGNACMCKLIYQL
jgi:hypothetical protein